ncbi:MAG TPA: hypothetical protein VEK07_00595 [Polyangiaceae bacterium]|nr:hypothetical protein [Polyangiaceae bacterium]
MPHGVIGRSKLARLRRQRRESRTDRGQRADGRRGIGDRVAIGELLQRERARCDFGGQRRIERELLIRNPGRLVIKRRVAEQRIVQQRVVQQREGVRGQQWLDVQQRVDVQQLNVQCGGRRRNLRPWGLDYRLRRHDVRQFDDGRL